MVRVGAGIFDKLEPEPHKNGPAPQHWLTVVHTVPVCQNNKGTVPASWDSRRHLYPHPIEGHRSRSHPRSKIIKKKYASRQAHSDK
jgi:hypothetical protein